MKVLITGGAGFIGSTVASACSDRGVVPVVLDDLSTGRREFADGRPLYVGDVGDQELIDRVFADHPDIDAVVHCAARTVVPDSVSDPLGYYRNNVGGLLGLLEGMQRHGCRRLVFSSSAAVYAPSPTLFVDESSPTSPSSPYASTKLVCESVIDDLCATGRLSALSLRYFNPVGADPFGRSGLQLAAPSHALGRILTCWREGTPFTVTGTAWPTRDGTGLRDYVHVWDLAAAHVNALQRLDDVTGNMPHRRINLGTGRGTTVRELVTAFSEVSGSPLQTVDAPARPGDVAGAVTSCDLAGDLLGWQASTSLQDGIRHALAWDHTRRTVLA